MATKNIFIVGAKRTPFGSFGGKLKDLTATDLCVISSKAALASAKLDPSCVDSVFVGNVAQTSNDAAYIARHVQLKSGIQIEKPALTINRLCGSGFQTVVNGFQDIQLGESEIALCGGAENMSQAPLAVYGAQARFGVNLGAGMQLQDTLWSALTDSHIKSPMGMTAEKLGAQYKITRDDCDQFALRSQHQWAKANQEKKFANEIAPIELKGRKGIEIMDTDEFPRGEKASLEQLAKLKPVFQKDGLVTAGSASGICDGAGTIIVASENAVKQHNLTPLARVVSYCISGVDPTIMGIGPVPSIRGALQRAGLKISDIDHFEINEAFAAQFLACEKELGLDREKTNINGGAIALGHPLAASGSRITAHLVHQLVASGKRYGVGSACIGGGQGIAIVVENCS